MGAGDHKCHTGQERICTVKPRDKHDVIIVQEKLDGSNTGIARLEGMIYPLTRAGYLADSSPYEQHWRFSQWVYVQQDRFLAVLRDGERLCGEWLMQAHGTRYELRHEPFVAFDLMTGTTRTPYAEFLERVAAGAFVTPHTIHVGGSLSVAEALAKLGPYGFHGARDIIEGAVWRVERNELVNPGKGGERRWVVDFLAKYVRPDKVDGCFLSDISGRPDIWNYKF